MIQNASDLRLEVPSVEPTDDLVHRLSALARASTPTRSPFWTRFTAFIAAGASALFLSVGAAWATGAIEVPGVPSPLVEEAGAGPSDDDPTAQVAEDTAVTTNPGSGASTPPTVPAVPARPGGPGVPATPATPAQPGKPAKPAEPVRPGKPVKPVKPGRPAEPGKPVKPGKPVRPGKPARPGKPTKPVKPAKPSKPVKPKKPKKDKPAGSGKPPQDPKPPRGPLLLTLPAGSGPGAHG
ncbi:MAG: hypothetical protein JWN84_892 [Nocardioides sp.]|nr:hypothetical protein [Nocardioides sp.]